MGYYTTDLKLHIQILVLGKLLQFFKWHDKRWEAYFEKKEFDKFYKVLVGFNSLEKSYQDMIFGLGSIEQLKEAIAVKQLTEMWINA